ncbi:hypothetical protein BC939DRAFT_466797 [Gamsiella multidivaricata]|uniref:uncharacterized protein n=1 Tax=Gamsiella multidivaricata TaxID=101098 RepID=UPI0022209D6D|nr:uncharacterized protein BC939DRAFT_466797 [Gamsiella multidivaricata]KAI7817141.1 hypothetical protein BC939DRAFT_466797 [Gamsiella multidivaricata]
MRLLACVLELVLALALAPLRYRCCYCPRFLCTILHLASKGSACPYLLPEDRAVAVDGLNGCERRCKCCALP